MLTYELFTITGWTGKIFLWFHLKDSKPKLKVSPEMASNGEKVSVFSTDEERLLVLGATGNVGRHVVAR